MFTLSPDLDPLYVEYFLCADSSVGYVIILLHNWIKRFMDYEDLNGLTRQVIVTWKVSTIGLMVAQARTCQSELKQQPICRGSAMLAFAPGHE